MVIFPSSTRMSFVCFYCGVRTAALLIPRSFAELFEEKYGPIHPPFFPGTLRDVRMRYSQSLIPMLANIIETLGFLRYSFKMLCWFSGIR